MADPESAITHGGGLIAARARFRGAPEPWIDLSTGINAVAYPIPRLEPDAYRRLPEPEAVLRLEAAAASAYGVDDPRMLVAAPGTQILISLLPRLLRLRRVAIVCPTYAEHAAAWAAAGTAVSPIGDIASVGTETGLVLCNPNNPDGRRTPAAELVQLAKRLEILLVDEAFADLEDPGLSIASMLPGNAIALRSFGKTYGLAGLRLGFAIAAPAIAQAIRAVLGPWAVSGAAIRIGVAALGDGAWLDAARTRLTTDAGRLDGMLTRTGFDVMGGTRLFRLARTPEAEAVFDRLGRSGILVRRFDAQPSWLRVGVPGDGWDRIEAALRKPR